MAVLGEDCSMVFVFQRILHALEQVTRYWLGGVSNFLLQMGQVLLVFLVNASLAQERLQNLLFDRPLRTTEANDFPQNSQR